MMWSRNAAIVAVLAPVLAAGVAISSLNKAEAPPASLAAFAPQGSLLAIESPDFSDLLRRWNTSAEQKRWLAGDDYSEFSRSRLFARLGDAQTEFAAAAGVTPDTRFLQQVAGSESLFAWYDIGNLEFLYITRMPAGDAAKCPLMLLRDRFEQRKVGDTTFYVRTSSQPDGAQGGDGADGAAPSMPRTVAFAVRGDYLLLASREDLLANALELMEKSGGRSLQNEGWYANATSAAGKRSGILRMTLNLDKIVPSPYFRSYWIQQNITQMKQYSAMVSDLYRDAGSYREERMLLPSDSTTAIAGVELGPLRSLVPAHGGVYRIEANPSIDKAIGEMDGKLITREVSEFHDTQVAPVADLSTPSAGDSSELEERIDAPVAVRESKASSLASLRALLLATPPTGMLAFSSAAQPGLSSADPVFLPIHNAVAFLAASDWNDEALKLALSRALRPGSSASGAGLGWTMQNDASGRWYRLDGERQLAFAVRGKLCIVATDESTLRQLLDAANQAATTTGNATIASGFDFTVEHPAFDHLVGVLDPTTAHPKQADETRQPFFPGNIGSLGYTFQDLATESFVQSVTPDGRTRQTVTYTFRGN